MTNTNVIQARTMLRKNRAAKFPDQSFICFATPEQIYSLQTGTGWTSAVSYADSTKLISGEVGRYMGVRFVESDILADNTRTQRKTAAGTGTSYTALMVGAQALGKGFDLPLTLTYYDDDPQRADAGYFKRLQWNARGRYARLKASEVIPIITTVAQAFYAS
jgi:N4-gp56 family major capsid protein